MATKKKKDKHSSTGLPIVHRNAAGIDIGSTFHVVAVSPDADAEPVRTFRSFTGDLHRLADWLTSVGITTVAMESTSVYWIPVYEILEARGFEVVLVNARDANTAVSFSAPGAAASSATIPPWSRAPSLSRYATAASAAPSTASSSLSTTPAAATSAPSSASSAPRASNATAGAARRNDQPDRRT